MVYSAGFLLVTLALQLRFSTLPTTGQAYFYAQYSTSTTQPLPFAPGAMAYQLPTQKVAPEFGREPTSSSGVTDSSALQLEATRLSVYQQKPSNQDGFSLFWKSVSDELEQAWLSIRAMLR